MEYWQEREYVDDYVIPEDQAVSSSKCFIPAVKRKKFCYSRNLGINTNSPIKMIETERISHKNQDRTYSLFSNMSSEESSVIFQPSSDFSSFHNYYDEDGKVKNPINSKTDNIMSAYPNQKQFLDHPNQKQFLDQQNEFNEELQKYSDLCSPYFIENLQYPIEKNKSQNHDKPEESIAVTEFEPKSIENWKKRTNSRHQETVNKNNARELKHQQEDIFPSLAKNDHLTISNSYKHLQDSNYAAEHKHVLQPHCTKKENSEMFIHNHDAHFLHRRPIPPLNLRYDFYESTYSMPNIYLNPTVGSPHMYGSNLLLPNGSLRNSSCSWPVVQFFENRKILCNQSGLNKAQVEAFEQTPQKLLTAEKENTKLNLDFYKRSRPLETGPPIHRSCGFSKKMCTATDILNRDSQKLCKYNKIVQNSNTSYKPICPRVTADTYVHNRSPYFSSTDVLANPYLNKRICPK